MLDLMISLLVSLLRNDLEVCHSVVTEPGLQPLSGEFLKHKTANDVDDDACVDIVAENLWCRN